MTQGCLEEKRASRRETFLDGWLCPSLCFGRRRRSLHFCFFAGDLSVLNFLCFSLTGNHRDRLLVKNHVLGGPHGELLILNLGGQEGSLGLISWDPRACAKPGGASLAVPESQSLGPRLAKDLAAPLTRAPVRAGATAALGHSRPGAVPQPDPQLHPGLHRGRGGVRHHK